ncbi:MAG: hypothetical protein JO058_22245, partial [Alphaproteobacteria bacterium]|nr:hypothetical protein [Alphaproteobacteria bacterium]
LSERWGTKAETRANVSDHWMNREDLTGGLADELGARIEESQRVYDVVCWALAQKGKASITGSEIAEIVGSGLLDEFPAKLASERRRFTLNAPRVQKAAEVVVIQGKEAVDAYLRGQPQAKPHFAAGFGQGADGKVYLREGWANPEPEFVWTTALVSHLEIPKPGGAQDCRLRLIARPFVVKDRLPRQRFSIAVNGVLIGSGEASERAVIECDLPRPVLGGGAMAAITLTMPDAVRPSEISGSGDRRQLGLAIERIDVLRSDTARIDTASLAAQAQTAAPALYANGADVEADAPSPPLRDLMMRFESLGESCEFGLVQRRCEAEPLGLFRFASAPLPKLLAALNADFVGFGEPDALDIELSGGEYMVSDKRFGLLYHAWVKPGEMTPEDVHTREVRRLPLLIRKLREDLSAAEKIFVYHGMGQLGGADALPLAAALRHYGPNTLLWVELADGDHPAGTVEWAGAGLLKAYIDRFAPSENAHDLSLDCWIAICRAAWRLQQGRVRANAAGGGAPADPSPPSLARIAG